MFVKPGTGPSPDEPEKKVVLKVRDPITKRFLPEDGAEVPNTSFWRRLVRDCDVVITDPPVAETVKDAAAAVTSEEAEAKPPVAETNEPAAAVTSEGS